MMLLGSILWNISDVIRNFIRLILMFFITYFLGSIIKIVTYAEIARSGSAQRETECY